MDLNSIIGRKALLSRARKKRQALKTTLAREMCDNEKTHRMGNGTGLFSTSLGMFEPNLGPSGLRKEKQKAI